MPKYRVYVESVAHMIPRWVEVEAEDEDYARAEATEAVSNIPFDFNQIDVFEDKAIDVELIS